MAPKPGLMTVLVSHVMCCFDRCKGNPRNLKYGVFGTLDVSFDYLIGKVAIIFIKCDGLGRKVHYIALS